MSKNIVHEGGPGSVMPWTNGTGSDVAAGAIVALKNCIGIALVAIANGAVGSVAVEGVVRDVPKATGHAWAQGEKLIWDVSVSKFDYSGATPATGDITGAAVAWLVAGSSDTTGVIKLTPGNTTVT
ncbi:MAG: capsid cement protein [Dokdonella sp.]|uniref:capsid cement protein n=1 Tax=Dokdonella sp. TaxID=2291710 RepID=UPI003F820878